MSEQKTPQTAQEMLGAILEEERRQTKLLRPVSTLATIQLALLLIGAVIGIGWLILLVVTMMALR